MKSLKVVATLALSLLLVFSASAQKDKEKRKSPPAQVSQKVGDATITIDYSRPSKRGRDIFGGLEDYGKVWRTGANESTWIELSKDVTVEGKKLPAGKYGLFSIPGEDEWTIIFNKKWDGWGAYEYKESDDVLRVKVKASSTDDVVEMLTFEIEKSGDVIFAWDQTKVEFSIR
ncbi:DUF2911 domain-containing protein [Ekhidna sp.]|uniref:DUF2911 domain-containing protein n=1 Tax=Ekhidna sp. TaxID=2608089 RepID=UPI0032974D8B